MPDTRPTQIRLTEQDRVIVDELKRHYGLTELAETIRYAIREAVTHRRLADRPGAKSKKSREGA